MAGLGKRKSGILYSILNVYSLDSVSESRQCELRDYETAKPFRPSESQSSSNTVFWWSGIAERCIRDIIRTILSFFHPSNCQSVNPSIRQFVIPHSGNNNSNVHRRCPASDAGRHQQEFDGELSTVVEQDSWLPISDQLHKQKSACIAWHSVVHLAVPL